MSKRYKANKHFEEQLKNSCEQYAKAYDKNIVSSIESAEDSPRLRRKMGSSIRPPFEWTSKRIKLAVISCVLVFVLALSPSIINTMNRIPSNRIAYASNKIDYNEKHYLVNVDEQFTDSIKEFSTNLAYEMLNGTENNENFSPYITFTALSILSKGANGETQEELLQALNLDGKSSEYIEEQTALLFKSLQSKDKNYTTLTANSVWLQDDFNFKDSFIEDIDGYYTSLYSVDFNKDKTANYMSQWVSDNTKGLIAPKFDLANQDIIMSILSSIYYKATWNDGFSSGRNKSGDFHLLNGETKQVEYMNDRRQATWYVNDTSVRASKSLMGGSSMVLIAPQEGYDIYDIMESPETLYQAMFEGEQDYGEMVLQMPKFTFKTEYDLIGSFEKLGIEKALNPYQSDFSNMTEEPLIYLGSAKQQTTIEVAEKGVIGSAYIELMLICGSAAPGEGYLEMKLTEPFIYAIMQDNVPLFIGVVTNP